MKDFKKFVTKVNNDSEGNEFVRFTNDNDLNWYGTGDNVTLENIKRKGDYPLYLYVDVDDTVTWGKRKPETNEHKNYPVLCMYYTLSSAYRGDHYICSFFELEQWSSEIKGVNLHEQKAPAEPQSDLIDKQDHYTSNGIEPIELMRSNFTKEEYEGFLQGNVLKYMLRYKKKNGLEDLKKAKTYLTWLIESVGGEY